MRTCPSCKATYAADAETCAACGTQLAAEQDETSLSMSDTMEHASAAASGGAVPRVRTNPTPRGSQSGRISDPGTSAENRAPRPDSIVGSSLAGRYQVTRKIGEGGMGAVYEARHLLIGKRVAIKVLLDKYAQKTDVVARLQQEARLASSIGHEHIVDITDFGETDDGRTFVVMEFLDGESLAQLLQREGPITPSRAISIMRQVSGALHAAHGKGIVHRDVKPENVFITRRNDKDFVKVVDFGISKAMRPEDEKEDSASPRLTQTGMVLGTPLYMSPEQARGEDDLDHRIDVYACGVILYEILTGEVPFRGTNYLSIISQVLSQDPRRPSEIRPDLGISPALESVVMKAMAKDRAHRYADMASFDADLARIESGDSRVTADAPAPRRQRAARTVAVWAGALLVVVAAAGFTVLKVVRSPASDHAKKVEASILPSPAPPPPAPAEDTRLKEVVVSVNSDPIGAEVWWGAVYKGTTPTSIRFPVTNDLVKLTLKKDGYLDASVETIPFEDQKLTAKLDKKPPEPKAPPRRPTRPNGTGTKRSDPEVKQQHDPTGGEIKPNPLKPKK